MRSVIFRNYQSLGEAVAVSACVRDLHRAYPGEFLTDTRTPFPQMFENNPYITYLDEKDKDVRIVDVKTWNLDDCQTRPWNFIQSHVEHAAHCLNLPKMKLTAFQGDIHMASWESIWRSPVAEIMNMNMPYWLVLSGGKTDITTKHWGHQRFQSVVDSFAGKIFFVQVGNLSDDHAPLRGVLDLRGRTDLRQLIRIMHYAKGLLCGITGAMHISAATPQHNHGGRRPAVILGGGREPQQFWSYPFHQNLSTVGSLPCNDLAGCWKDRTVPLHDGLDNPDKMCVNVINASPRCMANISPFSVIDAIDRYFQGGRLEYLKPDQWVAIEPFLTKAT